MATDNIDYHCKLPEDLLIEIFLRSSVESLLRVKCVCKHWYALIKNPSFIYKHLQFQKMSKNRGRLLLQHYDSDTREYSYLLFDDETLASDTYHYLHYVRPLQPEALIEGPVNGLYCLYSGRDNLVLWNPAMKQIRFLPLPRDTLPHAFVSYGYIGFGTNPLSEEDYKVVLVCQFKDKNCEWRSDVCAMVYTLSTDTWRLLDDCLEILRKHFNTGFLNSTYLNGFYYWWGDCAVLVFDMGNNAFQEIPGPSISQFELGAGHNKLMLYNNRVALLIVKEENPCEIDIWVMLEDGIWFKQFSLGAIPGFVLPLGFWKNGDEFIFVIEDDSENLPHSRSQTVLYNPTTQQIRNLGPRGATYGFKASVYYESLVSLGGATEYEAMDFLQARF